MPGGAGFGAAGQRDPGAIERDLTGGIVTPEGARSEYGFAAGSGASDA